VSTKIESEALG